MTRGTETIDLAVRSIEIIDAHGSSRRHLRVFCPAESRSIDPQTCARCDLCGSVPEDWRVGEAGVRCSVPRRSEPPAPSSWFVGRDPVSTWTPAGAAAGLILVCAREEAPMRAVSEALAERSLATALVVDERTRVLGVVSRRQLSPAREVPVLAVVDAEIDVISESAPLTEVIARMAYRRAHSVALVSADGRAAGLVSEITLLHWVAGGGSSW
jgi:hypothetical protein